MKILSIESSCDETAISIVDFSGRNFSVLSDITLSQIDIHKKYGGVFPALAKREHIKNIYPLLLESLKKAKLLKKRKTIKKIDDKFIKGLEKIMEHDSHNFRNMIDLYQNYEKPNLKCIPVTYGPGLEMSLWTGFNIARCIEYMWNIPMVPVNHMEGHIYSSLIVEKSKDKSGVVYSIPKLKYPALSLLISGGHTELVLIKDDLKYKIVGQTLDDAVGEAYDKSARLLGVPYPGGPVVSKYAEDFRKENKIEAKAELLPRPMLHSKDFDFSFSGLKTAVLNIANKQKRKTQKFKNALCYEFEEAVAEVLIKKTSKAIQKYKIKDLILGGGVSANDNLRREFKKLEDKNLKVYLPEKKYTGDNALMIAIAGYFRFKNNRYPKNAKKVVGNLKLK